jgi:hypothetical protein
MSSWLSLELHLKHATRKLGPLVLKDPKSKETPNIRPLTFRVSEVCHVGYSGTGKRGLTLHGAVNVRDFGASQFPRVTLVQKNAAKMRSMVKPAADAVADWEAGALAAIQAEFTADQLDSMTELEYRTREWHEDIEPWEEAALMLQGVKR